MNKSNIKSSFSILLFLILLTSILFCIQRDHTNPLDPEYSGILKDSVSPSIYINSPTSEISYVTIEDKITISGIAQDNKELSSIKWVSNSSDSGVADGLENWVVNEISLNIGDNIVKVFCFDKAHNSSFDEIYITRNQYLQFLGNPRISPLAISANVPTDVIIRVSIAPNPNLIASSVKLFELDIYNNIKQEIGLLYDDGDLNHGDDIKGDGIFSTLHSINEQTTGEIKFRITAKTLESTGEVDAYSSILFLGVYESLSQSDTDLILNIQNNMTQNFSGHITNNSIDKALELTDSWIKQQPGIFKTNMVSNGIEVV